MLEKTHFNSNTPEISRDTKSFPGPVAAGDSKGVWVVDLLSWLAVRLQPVSNHDCPFAVNVQIMSWVDAKEIVMQHIPSIFSIPDGLTEALGWVLYSCHACCMMGHFLNSLFVASISYFTPITDFRKFPPPAPSLLLFALPLTISIFWYLHGYWERVLTNQYISVWTHYIGTLWVTQTDHVVYDIEEILNRTSLFFYYFTIILGTRVMQQWQCAKKKWAYSIKMRTGLSYQWSVMSRDARCHDITWSSVTCLE